ncbi:unnamed protein product [Pedinophyceae sp. YPF-701]|nr:unnamed protein product [Pedinophyceae sp. YPF-701]
MGCCGREKDVKHVPDENEPVKPYENRRCTDILFLIIFIAWWVGMFVVCGIAFQRGEVERLLYGVDSFGNTCGTNDLGDRKKIYWTNNFDLLTFANIKTGVKICINECPEQPAAGDQVAVTATKCDVAAGTCTGNVNFYCPYRSQARFGMGTASSLSVVGELEVQYWDQLPNSYPSDNADVAALPKAAWQTLSIVPGKGPCSPILFDHVDLYNRCFPKLDTTTIQDLLEGTAAVFDVFAADEEISDSRLERYVADIYKGIMIICVAGLVCGFLFSIFWMIVLRYFSGLFAWFSIIAVNVLALICTLYCFAKSGDLAKWSEGTKVGDYVEEQYGSDGATEEDEKVWRAAGITLAVLSGLLLLLTLLMIRRVKVAVACLKVAAQAVGAVPTVLIWPIFPFLFLVGFLIYWIFVMAMLYAAGEIVEERQSFSASTFTLAEKYLGPAADAINAAVGSFDDVVDQYDNALTRGTLGAEAGQLPCAYDPNCYYKAEWDGDLQKAALYHIFGFFWTVEFVLGVGSMVLAMVFVMFYFTRGDRSKLPRLPLWSSFKTVCRYHLGSIALGSFIIAVVQMIRFLVDQLDRQLKKKGAQTQVTGFIFKCVKCCLWIIEKILKFINKNAYIVIAITGRGFCWSAIHAASLILKNILRFAAVNVIGGFLMWLGKLAVMGMCALVAFGLSDLDYYSDPDKHPDTVLTSPVLPILISAIVAFVVAQIFFQIYDMGVDTVLMAFCEDCEKHDGNPKYAPPLLLEAIGKQQQINEKEGVKKNGGGAVATT